MTAPRKRRRYAGPMVIRTPIPEGAIDLCAVIDAERAERRRKAERDAWARSWRGRLARMRGIFSARRERRTFCDGEGRA